MGKILSETDCAYIAGVIDADGAIMASIEQHNGKRYGFRVRVIVKITQKNPEILHWVKYVLSVGSIIPNRLAFDWIIKGQKEVLNLLNLTEVHLIGKKKQAQIAQEILNLQINSRDELIKAAQLADELTLLNIRSKN